MRPEVTTKESKSLSRIVLLVSEGHNYAQKISTVTGTKPGPIVKQLRKVTQEGYLTFSREPLLNKKIYSVQWEKIIREFIPYLKKEIEINKKMLFERNKQSAEQEIRENVQSSLMDYWSVNDKKLVERLITNPYITGFFKDLFHQIIVADIKKSLNDIFSETITKNTFGMVVVSISLDFKKSGYGKLDEFEKVLIKKPIEHDFWMFCKACSFAAAKLPETEAYEVAGEAILETLKKSLNQK